MSTEDAFSHFIEPMSAAFGAVPAADVDAFFQTLAEELGSFSPYQLAAGARQLRRERTARTFPTIAECIAVCDRWPREEPLRRQAPGVAVEPELGAERHVRSQVISVMRSDLSFARHAAKEGWLGQLFDYVKENGILPPREAAARLCAQAERTRSDLIAAGAPTAPLRPGDPAPIGFDLMPAYRARYLRIQREVFGERQGAMQAGPDERDEPFTAVAAE